MRMEPCSPQRVAALLLCLAGCPAQDEAPADLFFAGEPDLAAADLGAPDLSRPDLAPFVLSLQEDRVLTGEEALRVPPPGAAGCRIEGNGFSIITREPFVGRVSIAGCEISGLGRSDRPALDLTVAGDGQIELSGNTFASSGAIRLVNQGSSGARVEGNRILESALVPVGPARYPETASAPVFVAIGASEAQKVFAGNVLRKSWAQFDRAKNWLIGGKDDGATNFFVAPRGGLEIAASTGIVVRGNYVSTIQEGRREWAQVTSLDIAAQSGPVLVEHNVIRGGQWLVRGVVGELRYNLLGDFSGHNWVQGPAPGARIHHNILVFNSAPMRYQIHEGVHVYGNAAGDVEIYNNTFDGGGKARDFAQPALIVTSTGFLRSVRSNAFVNFPFAQPVFAVGYGEPAAPRPDRLGYADHNLFHNPEATEGLIYGLGVLGKTEGAPGFGARDVKQAPRFTAPPASFPFTDDEVLAGRVTVSQILAHYRRAYTPLVGSPAIDAGDPRDGEGTDIGAIDAGRAAAAARFGAFPLP